MSQQNSLILWCTLSFIWLLVGPISSQPELILPLAHTGYLRTIDVHPNNEVLLSASEDGTVKLWDISSGLQRQTFQAHDGKVYAASFSEDGKFIISGGQDNLIRLWQEGEDEPIRVFSGHQSPILSVAIDRKNRRVLSGSVNGVIKLWDLQTGKCIYNYIGHQGMVNVIRFSQSEKFIISGGVNLLGEPDNVIRVWDITTGKVVKKLIGHEDGVNDLSISTGDDFIASASDDGTVRIWELETGLEQSVFREKEPINSVRFLNDNQSIMSSSIDGNIRIWNLKTEAKEREFKAQNNFVNALEISSDGQYFFSAGDYSIKLWDMASNKILRVFAGQQKPIYALAYSEDGHYLATGSINDNLSIKLLDMRTGHHLRTFGKDNEGLGANRLEFSSDNKWLISAHINLGPTGNYLQIWEVKTGKLIFILNGIDEIITDFELSENKTQLVYCTSSEIQICEVGNVLNTQIIPSQQNDFSSVHWSTDEQGVWVGAGDNSLQLLSLDGKVNLNLKGHEERIMATTLSPDKKVILAGGGSILSSELILWDGTKKQVLQKYQSPHPKFINCMDFSSDGKWAITGSHDGMICLWDINKTSPLAVFEGHTDFLTGVSFSPDDQYFISSSGDNTLKIWETEQSSPLFTLFSLEDAEWGIVNNEGYYSCSQTLARKIGFRVGADFYPFDQFDLRYNRPDLIAENMPYKDFRLIASFKRAFQKRLQKMGFSEEMLNENFNVPKLNLSSNISSITTSQKQFSLEIQAVDDFMKLDRILFYINGVPIFGRKGINLRPLNIKELRRSIDFELSNGENKIEISVINQGLVESRRKTINIFYSPK